MLSLAGRLCCVALSPGAALRNATRKALCAIWSCSLRKSRDPARRSEASRIPTARTIGGALVDRRSR